MTGTRMLKSLSYMQLKLVKFDDYSFMHNGHIPILRMLSLSRKFLFGTIAKFNYNYFFMKSYL